jgi:hypothetical protein
MKKRISTIVASFVIFVSGTAFSQAPAPLTGTWKFNPQKSKLAFTLEPQSLVRTYVDRGGGVYIFTQQGTEINGVKTFSTYTARDDGNEYPFLVKGADDVGTISIKTVDAYTAVQTQKVGEVTTTATRTISRDGKTLTITIKPRTAEAQSTDVDSFVFDKQ